MTDTNCPTGYTFYSCDLTGDTFRGCCADDEDPCNPDGGCMNSAAALASTADSTASSSTQATTSSAALKTSASLSTLATTSSTTTNILSASTSTSVAVSAIGSTLTSIATSSSIAALSTQVSSKQLTAISTTGVAAATATSMADMSSHTSTGAIVGGVAGGFLIGLLLLALVLWALWRRKQKIRGRRSATLVRRKSMEPLHGQDGQSIFAPFGGFYRGDKEHECVQDVGTSSPDGREKETIPLTNDTIPSENTAASQLDGSPVSELADTSISSSHAPHQRDDHHGGMSSNYRNSYPVSPITPRSASATPRHHAMSWNVYRAEDANSPPSTNSSSISPNTGNGQTSPETSSGLWTR